MKKKTDNLEKARKPRNGSGVAPGQSDAERPAIEDSDFYDPLFDDPEDCE